MQGGLRCLSAFWLRKAGSRGLCGHHTPLMEPDLVIRVCNPRGTVEKHIEGALADRAKSCKSPLCCEWHF